MNQQELFPNRPPQQSRITIGNRLLDILADIKEKALSIPHAERVLRVHFPGLYFQTNGSSLYIDGCYRGLDLSITYVYYEEIRGSKKISRVTMRSQQTETHYPIEGA